jgi:hypothetical protein
MSHERRCAPRVALLAAVLLVFAGGCAASIPEARFHVLAGSGSRILATTTETYAHILKLEQAFIVASTGDEKLTPDSFRPTVEGKSFDLEPELALREAALVVLVKYLQVLEAFASTDGEADVDEASLELGAAIQGLMEAAGHDADQSAKVSGILATGVDAIGRELAAGQRSRALARVMDASQKDVERLAGLVSQSHTKLDRAIGVMVAQLVTRANLIRPAAGTAARDEFYRALLVELREAADARAALAAMAEATRDIPVAHAQIRQSLHEARAPLDALKSLAHKAEQAGRFYGSTQVGGKNP